MSTDFGFKATDRTSDYYFISYNTEDADRVGEICSLLRQNGLELWYDEGIGHDTYWEGVIAERTHRCKEAIFFISKGIFEKAAGRELSDIYTYKEYGFAKIYSKKKIIVLLDLIDPAETVPHNLLSWWQELTILQGIVSINETPEQTAEKILKELGLTIRRKNGSWGPKRKMFSMNTPAEYPVMNSITDNPTIGDERKFVLIAEINEEETRLSSEDITVKPGCRYLVYIYCHNACSATFFDKEHRYAGAVRGLRLSSSFPHALMPGQKGRLCASLTADNTDPKDVWASLQLSAESPVEITLARPAVIRNDRQLDRTELPMSLFTDEGTALGMDELNGILFGVESHCIVTYILDVTEKSEQPDFDTLATLAQSIDNRNERSRGPIVKDGAQEINVNSLSSLNDGRFLYLGFDRTSFSSDGDAYFLYDKADEAAVLVHLDSMQIMGWVKCSPELLINTRVYSSPDRNYMVILKDNTLFTADLRAHQWLVKNKRIRPGLGNEFLYFTWIGSDKFLFFVGKDERGRTRIHYTQEYTVFSAKEKRTGLNITLCEAIGFRRLGGVDWSFFASEDYSMIAFDAKTTTYRRDARSIISETASQRRAVDGINCMSPDGKLFYISYMTGDYLYIDLYDSKDLIRPGRYALSDLGGIKLLNDYRVMIFNRAEKAAYLYDYKAQTRATLLDAAYFENSDAFWRNSPYIATYDRLTSTLLFVVKNPDANTMRVVAADRDKKIIGVSRDIEIPYRNARFMEITPVSNGVVFSAFVTQNDDEYRANGVNSYVYYIRFHRENGRMIFD